MMKELQLILFFLVIGHFAEAQQQSTFTSYFDVNKFELNSYESDRLSSFLSDSLDLIKISTLSGFTDTTGSDKYNNALAEKRIHSISSKMDLLYTVKSDVVGEKYAIPSNYKSSEYRKVEITYALIPQRTIVEIPKKDTLKSKSLNSEVTRFMEDVGATTFSYDLSILFYNSSDQVLPESYPQLEELLETVRKHPELDFIVHGHVCCSNSYDISLQRAQRVYYYLANKSVDIKRMSFLGHSNQDPKVFPEITEEDMKQNRRVEVEFIKR